MWESVGIERSTQNLELAQLEIKDLKDLLLFEDLSAQVIEVKNLLTVAELIIAACLARKESVGGHSLNNSAHTLQVV